MADLNWILEYESEGRKYTRRGSTPFHGEIHVKSEFTGKILSLKGSVVLRVKETEKIFMNGYQTWTYCPEYSTQDYIRGVKRLPKRIVDHFSLDRYSDYHFVDYPEKRGYLHGYSWMYFRDEDKYRFVGSLNEHTGYTRYLYIHQAQLLTIEKDCEGLEVDGEFSLFDLYAAEGDENTVFDTWFELLQIKPRTTEKLAGYSSWYNRYQDISEKAIRQDLSGCKEIFQEGDLFQIDDGWEPYIGDWLEPDKKKFPSGMKAICDEIHEAGYKAGLWLAPFVAERNSQLVKDHPDWLYLHEGKPWLNGSNWSGFYSLDIDNPEVIQYLEDVFRRVFEDWGIDMVKLDFLYGAAPFGNAKETRAERMYRAMDYLREWCGDHLILGCGVPVMPAFGIVDYCRISCDVSLDWNDKPHMRIIHRERPSTQQAIQNILSRRQLNNRAYISDPDVFFLRNNNIRLTRKVKDLLGRLDALMGGLWLTSDDPSSYDDKQKAQYRELRKLMDAEDVVFDYKKKVVRYTLDGKIEELDIRLIL
ncbi:MAG: alpha-galactosidase [Solobacterium sp.]|nr:alpha-galactosidase [Solobacterium sp.]